MRPLQRQVYKSVLEKNADLMQALTQATVRGGPPLKVKAAHNILMQLRKSVKDEVSVAVKLILVKSGVYSIHS
jgi:methylthioribose-1-phosphate isomerase